MKKLLIATAVGALVLTGCATNTPTMNQPITQQMHGEHAHKHGNHTNNSHHGIISKTYTCNNDANDASIVAHYNPDAKKALLNITASQLGLNGTDVEFKIAPTDSTSKSGSGMLFINDVNPNSKYEWHTKGNIGMLAITTSDGSGYSLSCQSTLPTHHHIHSH